MNTEPDNHDGEAALVLLAQAAVGLKVAKNAYNRHDGYHYASHDDVAAAVSAVALPLGLLPHITCVKQEIVPAEWGKGAMIKRRLFSCTWTYAGKPVGPATDIEIDVYANGAQDFGAAQSYAKKEWLKTTLLIETGEADADTQGDETAPEPSGAVPYAPAPPGPPPGYQTTADAKNAFLAACDGDKEAAVLGWAEFIKTAVPKVSDAGHDFWKNSDVTAAVDPWPTDEAVELAATEAESQPEPTEADANEAHTDERGR